ncbi:MAG: DNA polymerase III subunit beta [Bacteroidia bacterium]|jgi:DNA polymerase-3 subunit beta
MKFIVSSSALLRQLQAVQGVIQTNNVLPILDHYLFDVDGRQLTICTTDLNTTMRTRLAVEGNGKAKVAVPGRILLETLKTLPDQPISLALDPKTFAVELHTDKGKFKLSGENGEEFPTLPEMTGNHQFGLPSDALLTGISNTLFAVGTDELRLAMTGVKMECAGSTLSFVATDAHKLVLHQQGGIEVPASAGFIVPRKALNLLKATLPGDESVVQISYNTTHVVFAFGELELTCRLIDQKYPDYQAVIPKDGGSRLLLRRTEFLSSLRRISIYSSKSTYQVRLSIKGNELQMSAEDPDFANQAVETLSCEYNGADMEIGFNARFLIEMLSTISGDEVQFELSSSSRPGVLRPVHQEDQEDTLMLLMPVMLSDYRA